MADYKRFVRDNYGALARAAAEDSDGARQKGLNPTALGYEAERLRAIPQAAQLTLGCGNPLALAELQEGEMVLDLGCGGL